MPDAAAGEVLAFAADLVVRTERLDLDLDLDPVAVAGDHGVLFERGRHSFAGLGEALRIPVDRTADAAAATVAAVFGAVELDDELGLPGTGPVAFGALPFAPDTPGELILPAVLIGRGEDGTRWLTVVGRKGTGGPDLDRVRDRLVERSLAAPSAEEASRFTLTAPVAPDAWCDMVARVRDRIRAGDARKVVLAREVLVDADAPLSRRAILDRLRAAFPGCMLFSVDGFLGASPELLVARSGDLVRAHPLAGTAPRSADPTTDARLAAGLLASTKDREEHRITIDMVHDTLLPYCSYLDEEAEPSIVAVANVQHLGTTVEGRLSSPPASVLELLAALHPTPAVGGDPRDRALELLTAEEGFDRGRYAGPVGWVDAAGNGEWAVGIRSAEVSGTSARLFAGVGVVADSDPAAELAETRAKLQAMLSALVRP